MRWEKIAQMSYSDRMAAHREKERKVLAFLRREVWTTPRVLGVLLARDGVPASRQAVHTFVISLKKKGLLETETLDEQRYVIGITADGQARAAEIVGKELFLKEYEQGRVALSNFQHREDLQLMQIACAKVGWGVFVYPDRVPAGDKNKAGSGHRPDAIVRAPTGQVVAIECERTLKSQKRYAVIVGGHLSNIRSGWYSHVVYACPDLPRSRALQKIFHEINRVMVKGKDVPLTDNDRSLFSFLTYDQLPNFGNKE